MTYNALEVSNHGGKPIGLYKFALGSKEWCYTSADRDITYGGDTYTKAGIVDEGVVQGGGSADADDLIIKAQADLEFLDLYVGTPPSLTMQVTLRRMHHGDAEAPIQWMGVLGAVKRMNKAMSQIVCRLPGPNGRRRAGPRLCWERGCPHVIYDHGCKLVPADWAVAATVDAIVDGVSFVSATAGGFDMDYFTGGYIEWEIFPGVLDRRGILSHQADLVTVLGLTDGLTEGMAITLYPGDDRTAETCDAKFNNILNYGGVLHMPGKSPFDGNPIF